ncbi:hypothetical protein Hanom_Chr16g01444971 [Helianthus anomalus]
MWVLWRRRGRIAVGEGWWNCGEMVVVMGVIRPATMDIVTVLTRERDRDSVSVQKGKGGLFLSTMIYSNCYVFKRVKFGFYLVVRSFYRFCSN